MVENHYARQTTCCDAKDRWHGEDRTVIGVYVFERRANSPGKLLITWLMDSFCAGFMGMMKCRNSAGNVLMCGAVDT